jgi:hypothetical protein
MKLKLVILVLLFAKVTFSQDLSSKDKISGRAVIGFPGITLNQLNLVKDEFAKHSQVISAKFIFENHNCMLIIFDSNLKQFTVYDELLKTISVIYDVNKCYVKPDMAYDEISNHYQKGTEFIVK